MYQYKCWVVAWVDGDTVDLLVDLGFEISVKKRVRVYGLNTPETRSKNAAEKAAGVKAKRFAEAIAPAGCEVKVVSHKAAKEQEKFGRWLADITTPDGKDFRAEMLAARHGVEYYGGKRT